MAVLDRFHCIIAFLKTQSTINVVFYAVTPQPDVSLITSSLNSLSISWSVSSLDDVTGYVVFWSEMSAVAGNSMDVGVNINQHIIPNLLSNTAFNVTVQANGPLGSTNSTNTVPFYTLPKGRLHNNNALPSQRIHS